MKNEARVHLWYEQKFGFPIAPYRSLEAAIDTWPTTASSVAVRGGIAEGFTVYASFGLDDLLGMVVRPNKRLITREIYMAKAERWARCWPRLTVIAWED